MSKLFAWSLCALTWMSAGTAFAQPSDERQREAAVRFDHAVRLVNAGDLQGSLAEFERVYELVPAPIARYNVGLVHAALGRPVEGARALREALKSPESLKPEELERAKVVLAEQEQRIGFVAVRSNVASGVVEIDSVERAKLPLAGPLEVPAGPHIVGIVSPGFAPARRELMIAGRITAEVMIELVGLDRTLAHVQLKTNLPDADVFVDDARVGRTPLASTITVAPGTHRVTLARRGYVSSSQSIALQDGATGELRIEPEVDPTSLFVEGGELDVQVSETQALLSLDARHPVLLRGSVRVPAGFHRLRVERGGFLPAERDVTVPLQGSARLRVELEPTPETRASYVHAAQKWRRWSVATLATGVAVAASGTGLALHARNALPQARLNLTALEEDARMGGGGNCDTASGVNPNDAACLDALNAATDRVNTLERRRTAFFVTAGVGGALALTGLVLLLLGDNPHRYDDPPKQQGMRLLSIAPSAGAQGGELMVRGSF